MATGGKEQRETSATMSFPIVGIGASAGGLEAVSELLASLPAESGLALLLVQHLDPAHESLLAEILAKKTAMPVSKATEGMAVEPNRLYVIPHNASMTIADGLLRLQSRNPAQGKHMPIDVLFHSLAEDQGPNAIGVVLSGGGSDGALGIHKRSRVRVASPSPRTRPRRASAICRGPPSGLAAWILSWRLPRSAES